MEMPLSRQLIDEISAFNRKLRTTFDALVREKGLTLARARLLFALTRRDGLNQRELAEELELETPTLVRILDGMEAQGFVERRAGDGDRRAKQIYMTPTGKVVAAEIEELAAGLRAELIEGLSRADVERALEVVRTMGANLQLVGRQ